MHRIIASIAILTGLSAAIWLIGRTAPAAPPIQSVAAITAAAAELPDSLAPLHEGKLKFQGSLSCSATACHGSIQPDNRPSNIRGIYRNEYYVWFEQDPHARASVTLYSQETDGILQRLGWKRSDAAFQVCLDCHSPSAKVPAESGGFVSLDGVGCESCHGPAEQWRGEHYRRDWDRSASLSHGLIDTKNLVTRARLCADCHVGSPHRDVNHDLIAAGHPPLKFELSAYMDMLPKHWDDAAERFKHQDFEVQLWAAGQIASADAALSLLEARAKRAAAVPPNAVWPEFAEYDCYACHHDLAYPSWRQTRGFAGRTPGATPWGSWYFPMTERLGADPKLTSALTDLRGAMQANAMPNHADVIKHTGAARQALSTWLSSATSGNGVNVKRSDVGQLLWAIAAEKGADGIEASGAVDNWDMATQLYLTVVALNQSSLNEEIKVLRHQLTFPKPPDGYDSPKNFAGHLADSSSPRENFRNQLLKILQQLNKPVE
jgi:hypothetical protein